jgi:hypothetical protein
MHIFMTKGSRRGPVRWIHEEKVDDAVTFRAGRCGTDMVAEWPGFATLTCASDGSAASFAPVAGAARRQIAKLRDGQVRALLRDLAGELALHASAVAVGGRVVLFVGAAGAGKSTAAAEMCLGHGAQMFADDVASLEVGESGVRVLPSEADHWLTDASCLALGIAAKRRTDDSSKQGLRSLNIAREPSPLALVLALRFDASVTEPVVQAVRGSDAARLLLKAAVRFDVEDPVARRREFEQVTALYHRSTFLELVRPLDRPGNVAAFVIDALREVKS